MEDVTILPPVKGTCPKCGAKHRPDQPHDKTSLYYQMIFLRRNGRFPTWEDAMAHCTEAVKEAFRREMKLENNGSERVDSI